MTLLVLPLIATLLTGAAPAGAAQKSSKFEFGQKLFNTGEVDAALKALDGASMETSDPATLEKIHLLRAQCFAARQDYVKAEEAFSLALDANPETALDPSRVDPLVVKLLESVRGRLSGNIQANSTPAGATLYLDGRNVGDAPQNLATNVGKHKLEARWKDGPTTAVDIQVRPKREVRVEWVEGAAAPAGLGPVTAKEKPITPFGDVRGTLEIASIANAPPRGGIDVGGGFEVRYFRMGLWARVFPYFGVAPRFAFFVPVIDRVNVYLEAWMPVWFRNNGIALGFGAAGGAEFSVQKWLGVFLQIGGEHLFLNPNALDDTHFVATAGGRLRLP